MSDIQARAVVTVGFEGETLNDELKRHLDRGSRSVILFARNVGAPADVARLCEDIKRYAGHPVLVCTDQEGGVVRRLRRGFSEVPPMRALGRLGDPALARETGRLLGRELSAVGIDMNLAPVLDVDTNPQNPVIGDRSFSRDPAVVATLAVALAKGLEETGVASCGKHFPGHGDTLLDSHLALPRVTHLRARLDAVELVPFRAWCAEGLAALMTAHVVYDALDPSRPATVSPAILTGLLRGELGFRGLLVSDDLNMHAVSAGVGRGPAAVGSISAGSDLLLVCRGASEVEETVAALDAGARRDEALGERLAVAAGRVEAFIGQWATPPGRGGDLSALGKGLHLPSGGGDEAADPTRDGLG